jgi:plastocyanin
MADSLELVGVKGVRKHTGTEMSIIRPLRGGDTHQVKEWWRKSVNTTYATCTIFKVTTGDGTVKLALPTGKFETTNVKIIHDGNFNFTFTGINELDRAALFTESMQLIEHYIFPSISGGQIVTVTPPGAADRPSAAPPDTTISSVTVAGNEAPTDGDTETYTVTVTGDATPFTYLWGVSAGGSIDSGQGTTSAVISWSTSGAQGVTCAVSSSNANFDGNDSSDTLDVNVAVLFSTLVANADHAYVVTENGGNYEIDGVANDTITANAGETIHFDLSDASLSGHPFKIYTDATKTTEVTVGIEQQGTDLLFTPPIAGSFSYQCASHAGMGGDITVS